MAFTDTSGRTRSSLADINITPLVDVVLVLLIIFMLTAPVIQSGIDVTVPKTRTVKQVTEERLVITIKRVQALADLARRTRLQLTVRASRPEQIASIGRELNGARGANGLVRVVVPLASGGEAVVVAGRDYALDAELAARIERIAGEGSVDLSVQGPPKLALVG